MLWILSFISGSSAADVVAGKIVATSNAVAVSNPFLIVEDYPIIVLEGIV
jgi:hypothetical protein